MDHTVLGILILTLAQMYTDWLHSTQGNLQRSRDILKQEIRWELRCVLGKILGRIYTHRFLLFSLHGWRVVLKHLQNPWLSDFVNRDYIRMQSLFC